MEDLETLTLHIPSIQLSWSEWHQWEHLKADARSGGVRIPNRIPGVDEVKTADGTEERLTIGKASNLRHRIRQALVKGIGPHSTGKRIRIAEDTSTLLIRWAVTDWPAAAEEALHKRYVERFGRLPVYTQHS